MNGDRDNLDWYDQPNLDEVEVDCPCGHRFVVPRSLTGGLANCPQCRRATQVPGGPEPLFWFLLAGGIVLALLVTAFVAIAFGATAGVISLAVCALIIIGIVLAS